MNKERDMGTLSARQGKLNLGVGITRKHEAMPRNTKGVRIHVTYMCSVYINIYI